jgi:ADP-ribose pyrophosphatase
MTSSNERDRYDRIRSRWPRLFENLPDARYEILVAPELVAEAESRESARLQAQRLPESWSRTGVVYEDPYLIVLRDAVRKPDGSLGTYVRTVPASGSAGAAVIPLLDSRIVLLRHFRHATRKWHLEIPRGYGEEGVSAADQAREELREEIGAEADELVCLGEFHTNTGAASDQVELFLAKISSVGSPQADEGIDAIEICSPLQIACLIDGNDPGGILAPITDSFTIGAFTRAWLHGLLPGLPAPTMPGNGG